MTDPRQTNVYDDGNIPEVDLPQDKTGSMELPEKPQYDVDPLPESTRPRKDGPGGESSLFRSN